MTANMPMDGATPTNESCGERPRILHDLKALIASFAPPMRERLLAEIRSVLKEVTPASGCEA